MMLTITKVHKLTALNNTVRARHIRLQKGLPCQKSSVHGIKYECINK